METVSAGVTPQSYLSADSLSEWQNLDKLAFDFDADGELFNHEILPCVAPYKIPDMEFGRWSAGLLAEYIYQVHHCYFYTQEAIISKLLAKVMDLHSGSDPLLQRLTALWRNFKTDFSSHLMREEKTLFEYIRNLSTAKRHNTFPMPSGINGVAHLIKAMQLEHEATAAILREIRVVTGNYNPPSNTTSSHILLYSKLKCFEEKFLQDIQVEENILFPKTVMLEEELKKLHLL